jgi:hypothetical protein
MPVDLPLASSCGTVSKRVSNMLLVAFIGTGLPLIRSERSMFGFGNFLAGSAANAGTAIDNKMTASRFFIVVVLCIICYYYLLTSPRSGDFFPCYILGRKNMSDLHLTDLTAVHLEWCKDILKRIEAILKTDNPDSDKVEQVRWLVKQALKIEREE